MMNMQEAFALALGRVSRQWRNRLDLRLKANGLTNARWAVLLQLSRCSRTVTQSVLAERVGIEGPTLVRLLDAIEWQGLIERLATAADRRTKLIRLTGKARPVLADINRIAAQLRREILSDVSPRALQTCLRVLRQIGDRLGRDQMMRTDRGRVLAAGPAKESRLDVPNDSARL